MIFLIFSKSKIRKLVKNKNDLKINTISCNTCKNGKYDFMKNFMLNCQDFLSPKNCFIDILRKQSTCKKT